MALSQDECEWLDKFFEQSEDAGLTGWNETFVDDQRTRYAQYKAEIRLSPMQWKQLFRIASEEIDLALPPGQEAPPPRSWDR